MYSMLNSQENVVKEILTIIWLRPFLVDAMATVLRLIRYSLHNTLGSKLQLFA